MPEVLADVDVVFPLLHGPYGEDGTIQGLLELAGVPYVGSGVLASAAAMDKAVTKVLVAAVGVAQSPFVVITDRDWAFDRERALVSVRSLQLPVFVKPARAGSSVGISSRHRLVGPGGRRRGRTRARPQGRGRAGRRRSRDRVRRCWPGWTDAGRRPASVPRSRVKGDHDFYDFEAKYLDDVTELAVPADLPDEVAERVRQAACDVFDAVGCEDYARVDFFVTDDGEVVFNEINTISGVHAHLALPAHVAGVRNRVPRSRRPPGPHRAGEAPRPTVSRLCCRSARA